MINDVPTPGVEDANKVLKRIAGHWVLSEELTGVEEGQAVPVTSLTEGSIENRHLLDIQMNQVAGALGGENLEDDLGALMDYSGGTISGEVDLKNNDLKFLKNINYSNSGRFDMDAAIDLAVDSSTILATKQDKLPSGGAASQILVTSEGNFSFQNLDTENVSEGSLNLYFSEERVRVSQGFPLLSNDLLQEPSLSEPIIYGANSTDTIGSALQKIYVQALSGHQKWN